jgi:hypothetical protein
VGLWTMAAGTPPPQTLSTVHAIVMVRDSTALYVGALQLLGNGRDGGKNKPPRLLAM